MPIESFGLSDTGLVRTENQDRIAIDPAIGLYAVLDGMGGHRHGALAAELAAAAIRHFLEASRESLDVTWPFGYDFSLSVDANRLTTSIKLANRLVWRRAEEALEHAGMGTTVAALLLHDGQAVAANVGDSRVYLFRNGQLVQLSIDDTMVANLAQQGYLDAAELDSHPMRNILTQAAGAQQDVNVHLCDERIGPGDWILICSDGLSGVVTDSEIRQALCAGGEVEACARSLMDAARRAGAPDNVSVVLLRYIESVSVP
jgi:serine/threonine protein phosphatase PrpC